MKRIAIGLVCAALPLSLAPAAAGVIRIDRIFFDSPGTDSGSNASLNAEWIRLTNTGSRNRSITNWKIRDRSGHVFQFGPLVLRPGQTMKVHTGTGSNRHGHRYWGLDNYVWNNDGDRAKLIRFHRVVDRCSYSGAGSAVTC